MNMTFAEYPVHINSSRRNYNLVSFNATTIRVAGQANETSVHLTGFLNFIPWFLVILSVVTTLSNCAVLSAFVKNRNLRTAFNMYLINLLLADIAQGVFDLPLNVVSNLSPVWPLGHIGCNFSMYGKWVFSAGVRNTHSLISLNRIWALFFPISYKQYHTKTLAIWLCIATWVYVHVFLLPGLIPDALYFRVDDGSCQVNTTANRAWALPTQMILYNSTLIIILFTYPVIWWKIRQRRRIIPARNQILSGARSNGKSAVPENCFETCINNVPGSHSAPTVQVQARIRHSYSDEYSNEIGVSPPDNIPVMQSKSNGTAQTRSPPNRSQSFAVLTYLVIGVVVCWTPIMVFFTLSILFDYDNFLYFLIGSLLYYFNSVLDPIFFTMAITPLRMTLCRLFTCRKIATG